MPIFFSDIVQLCQVEAIANKLLPNAESRWRKFCREYSEYFSTPYHLVLEMDMEFVISSVYEKELDSVDSEEKLEELMDRVYIIEDPSYEANKEKDLKSFMKAAEEEEALRIKNNDPVIKKKSKKEDKKPEKELPKSGYVNLSYLESQDKEE